jgi:hypothetical protein
MKTMRIKQQLTTLVGLITIEAQHDELGHWQSKISERSDHASHRTSIRVLSTQRL